MKYLCILFLFVSFSSVFGNNIRVEGKTRVMGLIGNDTAVIEVNLLWDNSWRDDFNWDAAWVFFKYKKRGIENPWQHAYLSSSGHTLTPLAGNEGGGYTFMTGISSGQVTGLYIMREDVSEGNVGLRLRVKWPLSGTGLSPSDFGEDYDGLYVAVHAIEMVYIPYGAYYLGDNFSHQGFTVGDTSAVVVDSEAALNLRVTGGSSYSLSASYPKGYAGFYIMKYETSQEQYVEFLNSLTLEQQKARVMNKDFSRMKRGDYVFGDLKSPDCRNGIAFIEQKTSASPAVFGNNLNADNDFFSSDDGQTLACNYLSIEDMLSYCSWSGLRPMSELEYEKACRRFYPQLPDRGEYAWNTNNGIDRLLALSDLNYPGGQHEQALSYRKNVNSGPDNGINGPVRCGLFATSATNQTQAGATYWGVMEMSGNVKELCVNVSYSDFDGGSSGSGIYDSGRWENTASKYGVRGGGFSSADSLLCTSDRTEAMNYFTTITQRDSTVGFRGVYSLSGIKINGGEIRSSRDTVCTGNEVNILSVHAASCPDFPDVRFQYNWYVKKPGEARYELLENSGGESLIYEIENTTASFLTYQFRRTGICAMGVAESNEFSVTVLPAPFSLRRYGFNAGSSIDVPHLWSNISKEFAVKNAPDWVYVSNRDSLTVTVAGGLANVAFTLECSTEVCPGDVFAAEVAVNGTFVYKGVGDSVTLAAGRYKVECWGASGGVYTSRYPAGKGAYTKGEVYLGNRTMFYVYVGEVGTNKSVNLPYGEKGFNGAGGGSYACYSYHSGRSAYNYLGGGATDIRLVNGLWNDFNSLKSRIIVAAGGASGSQGQSGADAGGINGYSGSSGNGASQTSAGGPNYGGFGYGGTAAYGGRLCSSNDAYGSGSGYYGGGAANRNYSNMGNYRKSAGSGSSFISGHNGCDAVDASSTSSGIIHTGQAIHYSGLYFTNTVMIDGAGYQWTTVRESYVGMPDLTGSGTMTGNTGNGQVKITPLP